MPASIIRTSTAGSREAGPTVATILVRRPAPATQPGSCITHQRSYARTISPGELDATKVSIAPRSSCRAAAAREMSGQQPKPAAGSRRGSARLETGVSPRVSNGPTGLDWGAGVRFLLRRSPTLRAWLLRAAGERCIVAEDSRSGLWRAQERARKALVHANKVRERAKRALRVAAAHERSAARHDRHAETLEAHGAKRAAAAERRDARLDRDAADAERER
jgi:hypothetical protein